MKVLIADNDSGYRRFIRWILKMNARLKAVAEAADGEAAVGLSRRFKPDLVLMDIGMPRLDGLQATRRLKVAQDYIGLPIRSAANRATMSQP